MSLGQHISLNHRGSDDDLRELLDEGLDIGGVTVLVGENGSGTSTLVEAIAMAYARWPTASLPEAGSHSARLRTAGEAQPQVPRQEPRRVVPRDPAHAVRLPGFYRLDEPRSALSFSGCLALVGAIHDLITNAGKALSPPLTVITLATPSP